MSVEFYYPNNNVLLDRDIIYIDHICTNYAEISKDTRDRILADLRNGNKNVRNYITTIMRRGITDHVEIIKHTARRFFAPLNNIPDIDDNGNINIETE